MFHLLKEPFFNILRTQEQLGYIVSSGAFILKRVLHGRFVI
jgi:insulysin